MKVPAHPDCQPTARVYAGKALGCWFVWLDCPRDGELSFNIDEQYYNEQSDLVASDLLDKHRTQNLEGDRRP